MAKKKTLVKRINQLEAQVDNLETALRWTISIVEAMSDKLATPAGVGVKVPDKIKSGIGRETEWSKIPVPIVLAQRKNPALNIPVVDGTFENKGSVQDPQIRLVELDQCFDSVEDAAMYLLEAEYDQLKRKHKEWDPDIIAKWGVTLPDFESFVQGNKKMYMSFIQRCLGNSRCTMFKGFHWEYSKP